jgi:hypothetical protein
MNLSVRKAGEAKFSDTTKKIGVEAFVDENTGARLYISETGSIAAVRGGPAGASAAGPKHQYGYELRVRKGTEGDFTDNTQKFGVEVFLDEAGGTLIYVTETGAIAAAPAAPIAGGGEVKKPDWMFGLNLKVRMVGERDFTDATRKWGIEVFKDDKAGNLIYIGENGDLAVVPGGNFPRPQVKKTPTWLHDQDVRVRRGGEKELTDKTRKWGVEVFRDENTGNTIYITEAGKIGVVAPIQVYTGRKAQPKSESSPDIRRHGTAAPLAETLTLDNIKKVQGGMTLEQVEQILGKGRKATEEDVREALNQLEEDKKKMEEARKKAQGKDAFPEIVLPKMDFRPGATKYRWGSKNTWLFVDVDERTQRVVRTAAHSGW